MTTPPVWVLALLYWIHMLATIIWIGGLASINLLVLPASHRTLSPVDQLSFISAMQKRLEPLVWFSIGLLTLTGLIQMSVNVHYDGFLSTSTQWSIAMLSKHASFMVLIVVSAMHTWEVIPAIQRVLLKKDKADDAELNRLLKKEILFIRISLILAAIVLGATATARVA